MAAETAIGRETKRPVRSLRDSPNGCGGKKMLQGNLGTQWKVAMSLKLRIWVGEIMSLDFNMLPTRQHNGDTQFRALDEAGHKDWKVSAPIDEKNF